MPPPLVFRMMQGLDAEFLPCKHYMPNGFSVFFLYYPALQASLKDLRYQPRNVLLVCRMMRAVPYILGELSNNTASVVWRKYYLEEMVHLAKFLLITTTFRWHFSTGKNCSNEQKFCEVSLNSKISRCLKFQLLFLTNKKKYNV